MKLFQKQINSYMTVEQKILFLEEAKVQMRIYGRKNSEISR